MNKNQYDVIVIGAGHAGVEAAFASAHKGHKTALFTIHHDSVAQAPCNPSIGGPAKGIVTREIDALGGMQALATDSTMIQIKILNASKGPGVWALRAQIGKDQYHQFFIDAITKEKNIDLIEAEVNDLIVKDNKVIGVKTSLGDFNAKAVVITTGTYLKSTIHVGHEKKNEGPLGFKQAKTLSDGLTKLGFKLIRLKTGTPPRIDVNSFNKEVTEIQNGDANPLHFSFYTDTHLKNQVPCYLTYTNAKTHKIINEHLKDSAMYSGHITGVGPRYCPSIEDKIVRFSDKPRHQIFIEPVGLNSNLLYLQGLSTSLPRDVQEELVHSIKGLEQAKIIQYAYAIEYDAIDPIQLWPSLESKLIKNLYFAGQINGTSGYEEAAGQGLIAGINASLRIENKDPLILKRSEAYIGVMIDDIVTKGVKDPYRLLTSRAEHRLFLRNDNADERLMPYGYQIGLLKKEKYQQFLNNQKIIKDVISYLKNTSLKNHKHLKQYNSHNLYELLKRPEINLKDLLTNSSFNNLSYELLNKISIQVKYDGYIKHEERNLLKFQKYLDFDISKITNYNDLINLPLEAREKLNKVKPLTLVQASRISGISTNDLMIIKYYVENTIK
ncbi:MAG: tRNA uridine-5-carboxymethylaminomethyl(34) synthesis enzyme MnmG [Mycoplasma sp.]